MKSPLSDPITELRRLIAAELPCSREEAASSGVFIAETLGFCFGVKRALEMAIEAIETDSPVFTLGPIIHNPQVVDLMRAAGIIPVEDVEEIEHGTVVIRSHGATRSVLERAAAKGLRIVDATCPFVERTHKLAVSLIDEGYQLVIVGERSHPEVEALLGQVDHRAVVIGSPGDSDPKGLSQKVGIVQQTTQPIGNLCRITSKLLPDIKEMKIHNTICTATNERQKAALSLAKQVDLMYIVGGKNSANTTNLYLLCRAGLINTYHIETASELHSEDITAAERVGVTAGASTPDWIIRDVVKQILEWRQTT